ncbi:MAG: protein kinase [Acidimicrobiales bacterium]|nr:protein kinase [Acidimicrobiales bacterium]
MRYERVARLGRGGMGVVDLARGPDGTQVALKRLTFHGSADEMARARQRVAREAEVLTRLDHPNIVELLEVLDDGVDLTLVMPYLTGGTLAERVAKEGPVPAEEVEHLVEALGRALADAHRAGVVHRDIKPANVLFDAHRVPHLADFGVASSRDDTVGLTHTGSVVGTAGYMAPEQARGEPAGPPADVFALGATLLFAASGEGPYGRGAPDLLMVRAAQGKVRQVPRSVPRPLRRRLEWMLDPRAERRPSAAALVGGPEGTLVRPPVLTRPPRWPAVATVGGVGIAALLAAVVLSVRETGDPPAAVPAPTTTACAALPYQPCGALPAPNTDGTACLAGFEDYDRAAANGCEAAPDGRADGDELTEPIEATIVPRDDVDRFAVPVSDNAQLLCDGRLHLTLTAPTEVSLRLEVLDGDEVLAETTSSDGVPSSVTLREPGCFSDDTTTLTARVAPIGSNRSADAYLLERRGSY